MSTVGNCGKPPMEQRWGLWECPKTSLVPSKLKHTQSPKSLLSIGPSWRMDGDSKFFSSCFTSSLSPEHSARQSKELSSTTSSCMVAPPHTRGCWGQGFLMCFASRIRAAKMPGRAPAIWEWAHVQAAWAAGVPALPGCVLSYHGPSAAPKPPAARD